MRQLEAVVQLRLDEADLEVLGTYLVEGMTQGDALAQLAQDLLGTTAEVLDAELVER